MDRLDKAIAAFEDENSDLSLGERLSNLRLALQWAAFNKLKRIHSKGSKTEDEDSDELDFKQEECTKQFKIMEQMYYSQLKQNKASGKADDDMMDKDWIKTVKEANTLGSIVRDMSKKIA